MSAEVEEKLNKIPLVKQLVALLKRIILPGFDGLSLYDLLELYVVGIVEGTFTMRAGSIAYSFFIALFPFLLFLLNLIPMIRIENFQTQFLELIKKVMPPQTVDFFLPVIEDIALNPRSGLLSFTALLTLFLATNGVNSIFSAFEESVHVQRNRSIWKQYLYAMLVTILLSILLLIAAAAIGYGQYWISLLKQDDYIENDIFWINAMQYTIFVITLYILVATLYYFGVREGRESKFFSIGATLTTLLFMLTTYLFGVYINNFSQYNELYGSIGALLIMMFYIWINSNLLLLGFELNFSLQRLKDKRNAKNEEES